VASRGLESRIRKLEARHAFSRRCGGVVQVPCAPGEDIEKAAQALGLLDGLTGDITLVPATIYAEEWEAHVAAELACNGRHSLLST
jgi:hypothetical protein